MENDAFSDKSERENAEDSDKETQDRRRKAESGSEQSEAPGRPARRGTTYVVQEHEDLGEVRARPAWSSGAAQHPPRTPEAVEATPGRPLGESPQGLLHPEGQGHGKARMAGLRESREGRGALVRVLGGPQGRFRWRPARVQVRPSEGQGAEVEPGTR